MAGAIASRGGAAGWDGWRLEICLRCNIKGNELQRKLASSNKCACYIRDHTHAGDTTAYFLLASAETCASFPCPGFIIIIIIKNSEP